MEPQLKELLDKIYELEGLVHLALKREESAKDFIRIIAKKGKEVETLTSSLQPDSEVNVTTDVSEEEQTPFDEYSIDDASEMLYQPLEKEIIENLQEENNSGNSKGRESGRGKLVFSINERFRYKKELFENSDIDFNNTLALVASMENYEEAEDYFINEEGFDLNNTVVKEFMEIIKRYFQ